MVYHVSYWDLVLCPIYILFFYLVVIAISKKYYSDDAFLQKKLMQGFWIKIVFSILYTLITQFYFGGSDGFMYFEYGRVMQRAILDNSSNISFLFSGPEPFYEYVDSNTFDDVGSVAGYMIGLSNQIVARVSCVFSFFCFQNFSVISLFFSMLSYIGIWKMFLIFYKIFPQFKKQIGVSFLFLPSFIFWSSGIMKEPLCLFGLGIIISVFYNFYLFKRRTFTGILVAIMSCYFLYLVKSYIFFAFLGSFFIMLYSSYTKKFNPVAKFFFTLLIVLGITAGFNFIVSGIQNDATSITTTEELIEQSKNFKDNYEDMGGAFVDIGDIDPSVSGIAKKIPQIIVNVFFRPFPWEARSLVLIISMFESLFFLVLLLRGLVITNFGGFFKIIFKNPIYINCLVFTLLLGIIVGLTTFNFGTIIRYKIPCMPFFCMILLFVNAKKEKSMEVVNKH